MGGEGYKNTISPEILILTTGSTQDSLASALKLRLKDKHDITNCSVVTYTDVTQRRLDSTLCNSLMELERSVLSDPSEEEYDNIRHMLSTCEGLLWVTGDFTTDPNFNLVAGLVRSVRWERDLESPNLVTLAISDPRPSQDALLQTVLDIFEHQFAKSTEEKSNSEYYLRHGTIYTNRLWTLRI